MTAPDLAYVALVVDEPATTAAIFEKNSAPRRDFSSAAAGVRRFPSERRRWHCFSRATVPGGPGAERVSSVVRSRRRPGSATARNLVSRSRCLGRPRRPDAGGTRAGQDLWRPGPVHGASRSCPGNVGFCRADRPSRCRLRRQSAGQKRFRRSAWLRLREPADRQRGRDDLGEFYLGYHN